MLSVVCIKWGDWLAEWVNILRAMVGRHLRTPHEFVCLTDDPAGLDKEIRPIKITLPGWWGKMMLYAPDADRLFADRILHLDVDVVITGDLTELVQFPSPYAAMRDWPRAIAPPGCEKHMNSSCVVMDSGARPEVWDAWVTMGSPTPREGCFYSDQTLVNRNGLKVDLLPEEWVRSYKLHKMADNGPGDDCRVAVFHGRPKPWEVDDRWVKENWTI